MAMLGILVAIAILFVVVMVRAIRVASGRGTAKRDAGGETAMLSMALQDALTKLKLQERAMAARAEASEQLADQIVEGLTSGLVVVDRTGTVQAVNPAAQRILGMPQQEMIGLVEPTQLWQPIGEDGSVLHPQYLPPLKTLTTGEPQHDVILGVRRRNGAQIWISLNAQPLFAEGSIAPAAVVVSFVDITKRRAVEERHHPRAGLRDDQPPGVRLLQARRVHRAGAG